MKILHIFPISLYSNIYLDFISKDYNYEEHEFIMMDIGGKVKTNQKYYDIFKITDVSTFCFKDVFKLSKRLKNNDYDKLVVHSLYLNYLVLSLFINPSVLKRTVITLWGGSDCGRFTVSKDNRKYIIQAWIYNLVRGFVFRNVKEIGATLLSDYNNVVRDYKTKVPMVECKYLIPTSKEFLIWDGSKSDNIVHIQVGHSGSQNGNQIEILEMLKKYKEENICIHCPLAYGDDFHIERVIEYGKKYFGEKFIAMRTLMTADKYAEFINSMDILIINTNIQQALGNIYSYFYAGKKVYLKKGKELDNYFTELGFITYKTAQIGKESYLDFITLNEEVKTNNHELSEVQFDYKKIKKYWDRIFSCQEVK